ncbi:hypothetical protein JST97_19400 [bacterium]|nr:hypothetical protein [bacterium]
MQIQCSPSNPVLRTALPQLQGQEDKCKDCVMASLCKPEGLMVRPLGAPSGWSEASLNDSASDFVKSQVGEDATFGSLDGGNCGLTAYVLPEDKAKAVLSAAKEMYPGAADFQAASYDPAKQRMLGVLVSEDEPKLFVCLQSRADGSCKVINDIGFVGGMCSSDLSPATQEALVPADSGLDREDDWNFLTGALTDSKPLELGEEAGTPFWWK